MFKKCMIFIFFLTAFLGCCHAFHDDSISRSFTGSSAQDISRSNELGKYALLHQQNGGALNIITGKRENRSHFLQRLLLRSLHMLPGSDRPVIRRFACGNYFREINLSRFLNDLLNSHIIVRAGPSC